MAANQCLGVWVRKTIDRKHPYPGPAKTYRVRRGNGHYDSKLGELYQDKYNYTPAMQDVNTGLAPNKTNFAAAVDYWKNILTAGEKEKYNWRAAKVAHLCGQTLFISEAMRGIFHMYVDRGDPASYDFAKTDLTIDGAWHDLDLSAIVPKTARAVLLVGHVEGNAVDWEIEFKKYGQTNDINHGGMETLRANVERCRIMIVAMDNNQKVQYKVDNQNWTTLDLAVRGWWT